jgi:hypothetical protein
MVVVVVVVDCLVAICRIHQQLSSVDYIYDCRATCSVSAVLTSSLLAESELVKKIACKIARYILLSTIKK